MDGDDWFFPPLVSTPCDYDYEHRFADYERRFAEYEHEHEHEHEHEMRGRNVARSHAVG